MINRDLLGEELPTKKAVVSAVCTEDGMMFHFESIITGMVTAMHLDVDADDYLAWAVGGVSIQDALPTLDAEIRELFLSGMMPEDWDKLSSSDED